MGVSCGPQTTNTQQYREYPSRTVWLLRTAVLELLLPEDPASIDFRLLILVFVPPGNRSILMPVQG